MRLPSPGFLIDALFSACKRFPVAMIAAALAVAACIGLVDESYGQDAEKFYLRSWLTFQLGIAWLIALTVFAESKGWEQKRNWLLQALGFAVLIGCWFWLDPKADDFGETILPQYFALFLTAHLAVAFAPYLNARSVRDFWEYNRQLFANLIVGAAFTLIIHLGLCAAIAAIDILFEFTVNSRVYVKLFILLAGIFNTAYFLFHFPKEFSPERSEDGGAYHWVFRNLCKYILIPIVILYFLILYAYGAKIGLAWSLPKGWVSSLVIGFSVAGIFTYLLNFYLEEEDKSKLVAGFKRWFWWVLLPPTGLLFIAIGKRISDYGVTEPRFLVAQLGTWLAIICLYFLISKRDNLKIIPISLAVFALLWAFGPLSAFNVSLRSQTNILTEILERNGRFENGKMKPGTAPLTEPEREQAISAIYYLQGRHAINHLLPEPLDSSLLSYGAVQDWLKISDTSAMSGPQEYSFAKEEDGAPINLRGYDTAYRVYLEAYRGEASHEGERVFFDLSENGQMLEVYERKADGEIKLIESISLVSTMEKWRGTHKEPASMYNYLDLKFNERSVQLKSQRFGALMLIADMAQFSLDSSIYKMRDCHGLILTREGR